MRNQSNNLVVAPRAGFEPATNRLTAGSDPKFVSALYRAGSVPNYAQTSSDKGGSLIRAGPTTIGRRRVGSVPPAGRIRRLSGGGGDASPEISRRLVSSLGGFDTVQKSLLGPKARHVTL